MMRFGLAAFTLIVLLGSALLGQSNPVPFVNQPLVPATVAPGSAGFTLTVNGTGFVSGSVVNWNHSPRTTTFVNASQLTSQILASDVAQAGTAAVTVSSPSPGGGKSNAVSFSITSANENPSFAASYFPSGSSPVGLVAADLNNDGKMDLATANEDEVGVQLGNGDGTFQAPVFYSPGPTDENCDYLVAADVNADGYLDLIVLDSETRNVSVLINIGDGTFKPAVLYSTSARGAPQSFAMGDFNGDGALDIAVANLSDQSVTILLGSNSGIFQSGTTIKCCFSPEWLAVGDFNGDGILDLVVIDEFLFSVTLLSGKGDGTFQTPITTPISVGLYKVLVADFNGDGKLDLASITTNGSSLLTSVSILLGNGDGTFQQPVQYSVGRTPNGFALGDIDGDGKLDIVVANSQDANMSLLFGNGNGTFQTQQVVSQFSGDFSVVTADFDGDGRIDIANLDRVENKIALFLQTNPISLFPSSLSFPVQLVGTTSVSQAVTLTNTSSGSIQISTITLSGANPGDFSETNDCPSSLNAGATCTITVTFKPSAKNARTAAVTITDSGSISPQLVSLTGTGTVVSFSTARLNFGGQAVGTRSASRNFSLTNKGATALTVSSISVLGTNAADFMQKNNCGTIVNAGSGCTVTVVFTPSAVGTRDAYIRFTDNGGGSPQKVTLTGTGQ